MPVTAANGTRLAYDEAGTGPAVLLIHAALADRRMWEHQFHALAQRYRVIRFDWRGQGGSADAAGEFHRHQDVLGLMDALGVDRAALVGCSMGGAQALDVALAAPERVSALALVCPGLSDFTWPEDVLARLRPRIAAIATAEELTAYRDGTAGHVDPAHVAGMAELNVDELVVGPGRDRSALAPEVWDLAFEMCRAMLERSWTAPQHTERYLDPPASGRLAEVTAPTLVISGLADETSMVAIADRLAAQIKDARRIDMPDTAHVPPIERPEQTTAALLGFLAENLG